MNTPILSRCAKCDVAVRVRFSGLYAPQIRHGKTWRSVGVEYADRYPATVHAKEMFDNHVCDAEAR